MTRAELSKFLGSVAALVVSYCAAFWLFSLPVHNFSVLSRLGFISAVICVLGVGVFFWATILAPIAKKLQWSDRKCQLFSLITMIPAIIFLLLNHSAFWFGSLLLYQSMFTGFLLTKFLGFFEKGPFERNPPT